MIGKSFSQLGQAMEGDGGNYNPGLNNAVIATGNSFSSLTWLRLIMCFRWVLRGDRSTIRRAAAPRLGAHRRHDARLQGPAGWVASSLAHPLGEFSLWRLWPRSLQLPRDCSSRLCVQGAQGKRKEVEGENNANAVGVRKRGDAVSYSLLSEVTSSPC